MTSFDEKAATRVVRGEDRLIGIDELVERLGISRSTLDRWVKRRGPFGNLDQVKAHHAKIAGFAPPKPLDLNPFPEPATYLGQSPKWLESTVVKWLTGK